MSLRMDWDLDELAVHSIQDRGRQSSLVVPTQDYFSAETVTFASMAAVV